MTHFEYMEQQGQLTIFDIEDKYEELRFRGFSTIVNKSVEKN